MWISQAGYLQDRADAQKLLAERDAVKQQNIVLTNTLEWLQVRVTQLEHERASLIFHAYGVKVQVPTIERAPLAGIENPLNALPSFDDMGDFAAAKQGIEWNDQGEVQYALSK